jgi:hypothetical protein
MLDQFFDEEGEGKEESVKEVSWGSKTEVETRRRILLSLWAYAYEFEDDSLVPDHIFDSESKKVDLKIKTNNSKMDKWFAKSFDPSTGMWIKDHPELDKIKEIYNRIKNG